MSRDAEQFAEETTKLRELQSYSEGEYLHEYEGVLTETDESVHAITLSPELADNEAATEAFERVTGQWYNANTHENIVSIAERDRTPRPWIAIDQPHDTTLDHVQSQLTPAEIETVVTGTAEALRRLGLYNAVHGTLWPDDILVSPDGDETIVQVRGFGLDHAVRTALGEFKATPYTAPELLDDPDQPTEQTDVYGLGGITYFALTGQPPVDGANLDQAIREGPSHPPSEYTEEVAPELDDVVMQALSPRPGDRQDSPHAFKRAFLSAFAADELEADSTDEDSDEEIEAADATKSKDDSEDDGSGDNSEDPTETDVTRRVAVGVLGVGILGGAGWYLSREPFTAADQSDQTTTSETTTETAPPLQNLTQQAKLAADDGDRYDSFGSSVALSSDGSTALIGAYEEESNGRDAGSAYVFDSSGNSWTQQAKLAADDGDGDDRFGRSVALSSDGTTALIGAYDDEDPNGEGDPQLVGSAAGSAYVFDNSGDSWTQQAKLAADDGDSDDSFAGSVTLSSDGSTALIGAYGDEDPNGEKAGSAYVFDDSDGSWTQQAKLAADDGDSGDRFGWSVTLSSGGSTALISAFDDEDPNGRDAGSAYVFDNSGDSWTQQAKLAADDGDSDDIFGESVALSSDGTTALIGASNDEDPNGEDQIGNGAGSAYVFDSVVGSWTQQAKLAADDGDGFDFFGGSVALSSDGSTALIGATGANSGYVFE